MGLARSARVRRRGGGRKKAIESDPETLAVLDSLVEPESWGDPMSPLRSTIDSSRTRAVAVLGTSSTTSSRATSHWARCRPRPRAPSTAQRRSGNCLDHRINSR